MLAVETRCRQHPSFTYHNTIRRRVTAQSSRNSIEIENGPNNGTRHKAGSVSRPGTTLSNAHLATKISSHHISILSEPTIDMEALSSLNTRPSVLSRHEAATLCSSPKLRAWASSHWVSDAKIYSARDRVHRSENCRLGSMDSVVSSSNTLASIISESSLSMCESMDDCSSIASVDTPVGSDPGCDGEGQGADSLHSPVVFSEPGPTGDDSDDERLLARRVTGLVLGDAYNVDAYHLRTPHLRLDCSGRYPEGLTAVVRAKKSHEGIKETPYTPSKSPASSNTYTPVDGGAGDWGNGTGRKRGQSDDKSGHDGGGDSGDNGGQDERGPRFAPPKKQKMEENQNFSCPYRKRNPVRFNVRERHCCALRSFANMTVLKKHISSQHGGEKKVITCSRCQTNFPTESDRDAHCRKEIACEAKSPTINDDPEDMISDTMRKALTERKNDVSIKDWKKLWMTLFPGDSEDDIPSSEFEPVVEMEEYAKALEDKAGMLFAGIAQGPFAHMPRDYFMDTLKTWMADTKTFCRKHYATAPRELEPPTPTVTQHQHSYGDTPLLNHTPPSDTRRKLIPKGKPQRRPHVLPTTMAQGARSPATTMFQGMSASPSPMVQTMEYSPNTGYSSSAGYSPIAGYSPSHGSEQMVLCFNNPLHINPPSMEQPQHPQRQLQCEPRCQATPAQVAPQTAAQLLPNFSPVQDQVEFSSMVIQQQQHQRQLEQSLHEQSLHEQLQYPLRPHPNMPHHGAVGQTTPSTIDQQQIPWQQMAQHQQSQLALHGAQQQHSTQEPLQPTTNDFVGGFDGSGSAILHQIFDTSFDSDLLSEFSHNFQN